MTHADDYPIVIRRANSGYVAEAAALGLTRIGADVKALEADLRAAVNEILTVCDRHGAKIEALRGPDIATPQQNSFHRTIMGVMLAVLVIVVISMPVMWGYQGLTSYMSSPWLQLNTREMNRFLSSSVAKTADTLEMITPERRDELTHDFGRIARALEPYAAELRPLLVPAPVPPPQPANGRQ